MGRNTQLSLEDDNGRQLAFIKFLMVQNYFFKNGDKVGKKEKNM